MQRVHHNLVTFIAGGSMLSKKSNKIHPGNFVDNCAYNVKNHESHQYINVIFY